jgi:hypothetical protein
MKRAVLLGCLLSLLAGCEQHPAPQRAAAPPAPHPVAPPAQRVAIPQDALQGDFDGDGTPEYVWLVRPEVDSTDADCVGGCTSYIHSSNPALRPYALEQSIGGELTKFSNLGPARRDYLGILPQWFTSCWSSFHVITYQRGAWREAVQPFSTHCDQWEDDLPPIMPDSAHPGHVLIRYSEFANDSISVKNKSVPLS